MTPGSITSHHFKTGDIYEVAASPDRFLIAVAIVAAFAIAAR